MASAKLLKTVHDHWMTCEESEVDITERQLTKHSAGNLGERFVQPYCVLAGRTVDEFRITRTSQLGTDEHCSRTRCGRLGPDDRRRWEKKTKAHQCQPRKPSGPNHGGVGSGTADSQQSADGVATTPTPMQIGPTNLRRKLKFSNGSEGEITNRKYIAPVPPLGTVRRRPLLILPSGQGRSAIMTQM